MIFVTVGTHEQPFNRLIECVDKMKCDGIIQDEIIIQTGFSTYKPKNCKWSKFITYKEMMENVKGARIVITHGGPASFIMPLQVGKIPVVVPRQHCFDEHINNHQVHFLKTVSERMGAIIPVYRIEELKSIVVNYYTISASISSKIVSNNTEFNRKFSKIVEKL